MTENERDFLNPFKSKKIKWIGTRYWFYPNSIEIQTDLNYKYALITKPQFLADAERSREDFASPEEFEKKKKNTLSPSIATNIKHLNQNYNLYADAFPEIRELSTVARLMGLNSWLQKANPAWLDLDALLSVTLPPAHTIRETTKMLSVAYLPGNTEEMTKQYVIDNSKVIYISPILDMTLNEYFTNSNKFAKYLSKKDKVNARDKNLSRKISEMFAKNRYSKISNIINSKNDLKALAEYAYNDIDIPQSKKLKSMKKSLSYKKKNLTALSVKISAIKNDMSYMTGREYNQLVDKYNNLIEEYRVFQKRYNRDVVIYNQLANKPVQLRTIAGIGGGIDLEPRNFRIKERPDSPKLQKFEDIARKTIPEWKQLNGTGTWIRSRTGSGKPVINNALPKKRWKSKSVTKVNGTTSKFTRADSTHKMWLKETQNGSWREVVNTGKTKYLEKSYNKPKKILQIAQFESGKIKTYITGHINDDGKIIFRKAARTDLMSPQEPPIWWSDNLKAGKRRDTAPISY